MHCPEVEILNRRDTDFVFAAGFVVLGYHGSGTWRQGKLAGEQSPAENEIAYVLRDANTSVLVDGAARVLLEVIEATLRDDPNTKIKYFKMVPEPRDNVPGWFVLEQKHHLFWKSGSYKEVEGKPIDQSHFVFCIKCL